MTHFRVPTVDIAPWTAHGSPQQRARVAAAVDAACCTVGFLQVRGHGIDDGVVAGLVSAVDELFALPPEAKARYRTPPEVDRGWTPPGAGAGCEAFDIGVTAADHPGLDLPQPAYADNVWPAELPGFEPRVRAYVAEAGRVARTLTRIFACALDVDADFFTRATGHSADVLRLHHHAVAGRAAEPGARSRGTGEHTDPGILTVLWADRVPGLQVLGVDERWHDVVPEPGALLVNVGDLTARWTNDEWQSTPHRVCPSVVDGAVRRRRSAAFCHEGDVDAVVEAIPSCVPFGRAPTHPPTTIGAHLAARA